MRIPLSYVYRFVTEKFIGKVYADLVGRERLAALVTGSFSKAKGSLAELANQVN